MDPVFAVALAVALATSGALAALTLALLASVRALRRDVATLAAAFVHRPVAGGYRPATPLHQPSPARLRAPGETAEEGRVRGLTQRLSTLDGAEGDARPSGEWPVFRRSSDLPLPPPPAPPPPPHRQS